MTRPVKGFTVNNTDPPFLERIAVDCNSSDLLLGLLSYPIVSRASNSGGRCGRCVQGSLGFRVTNRRRELRPEFRAEEEVLRRESRTLLALQRESCGGSGAEREMD